MEEVAVAADGGSTLARRQLGSALEAMRERAQVSKEDAAKQLGSSAVTIWRIEKAKTTPTAATVEVLTRFYGGDDAAVEAMRGLAIEAKKQGPAWWHSYGEAIPSWFQLYLDLEAAAVRLRKYEAELVPGLLQTAAYAREVFRVGDPTMEPGEIEKGVALRIARQAILTRKIPLGPPNLEVVIHEGALRRRLADGVMAEQLQRVNEVGALPNVSVRVLPLDAGIHRGALAGGAFTILEFSPNGREAHHPDMVYRDSLTGALYHEQPKEVEAYGAVWRSIRAVSLTDEDSRRVIADIAKEHDEPTH